MDKMKSIQNLMLYGGITKDEYQDCVHDINKSNKTTVMTFSVVGIIAFILALILSVFNPPMRGNRWLYSTAICVLLCLFMVNKFIKSDKPHITNLTVYIYTSIMYLAGIFLGAVTGVGELAATFMVLLFAIPLLFITRPIYSNLFIVGADIIFVTMLHIMNQESVLIGKNTVNAVIYGFVSVAVSTAMMRIKIERIHVMERNRSLSENDQLTGLYNRRAYEIDISELSKSDEDFVYVSIDVNELKVINDSLGHEAGDEMLIGAADCMKRCFGHYGRIYRTGGDEFIALLHVVPERLDDVKKDFESTLIAWEGNIVDRVSASAGYVCKSEFPDYSIADIAKLADSRMYQEKTEWYKHKGVDRRGQAAAHTALCNLYTKILKINLTEDTYSIVNMDPSEQTADKGFADSISGWLHGFGKSGQVHTEDLEGYLQKTQLDYLKAYFSSGKTSISIFYRRKYGEEFKQVAMEMIPADDYEPENQTLYLYVKNIDL